MPIKFSSPELETRMEPLVDAQPGGTNKAAFVRAILDAACQAFESTGDPLSWMPTVV